MIPLKEIVNAAEAARILNMPEAYVRFYAPGWSFAEVKEPEKRGSKKKTNRKYNIKTRLMCLEYGIPLEEAERRLAGNG